MYTHKHTHRHTDTYLHLSKGTTNETEREKVVYVLSDQMTAAEGAVSGKNPEPGKRWGTPMRVKDIQELKTSSVVSLDMQ